MSQGQDNRRFQGYRTDAQHGIFGTLTIWNLFILIAAFVLGLEVAKRITVGPGQTFIALLIVVATFVIMMLVRKVFEAKPKYPQHFWRYWTGDDLSVVKPDRRPVPLLPIDQQGKGGA